MLQGSYAAVDCLIRLEVFYKYRMKWNIKWLTGNNIMSNTERKMRIYKRINILYAD